MASLRDIRKRIRSVKNTQQITKAMKMVAAAKLRKAQDAIIAARPYAESLDQMIADLAARSEGLAHPLLQSRPVKKVDVIVLTSDRGLAGGFNSNVTRRVSRFMFENAKNYEAIRVITIGRKGNEFFKRRGSEILKDYPGLYSRVSFATAQQVAEDVTARFLAGETDAVFLAYNEFISAISQKVVLSQMLPLQSVGSEGAGTTAMIDFEYEPDRRQVLDRLMPQAIAIKVYRALLESVASEHGARMSAMDNATNNASDMIGRLTLYYNRTRQAAITKELMEIVSGAEALK
ncbi:MAG: ATP synthase F1 subunit gamma [Myxococcaceae bacterium]|nr:ATP synthase F1 subunit gamma [Myxococcaceae bacterium]